MSVHVAYVLCKDLIALRRRAARLFPGLVLLVVLATASGHAAAESGYTDQSIQGVWGFSASGTIVPPALPAATPAVAMGTMAFDGAGGCSFADTVNIGGTSVSRASSACTYAVGAGGTGLIEVTFPGDPGPTPLSFVIVDSKKEIRFIRTDLGIASGVARRQ